MKTFIRNNFKLRNKMQKSKQHKEPSCTLYTNLLIVNTLLVFFIICTADHFKSVSLLISSWWCIYFPFLSSKLSQVWGLKTPPIYKCAEVQARSPGTAGQFPAQSLAGQDEAILQAERSLREESFLGYGLNSTPCSCKTEVSCPCWLSNVDHSHLLQVTRFPFSRLRPLPKPARKTLRHPWIFLPRKSPSPIEGSSDQAQVTQRWSNLFINVN